MTNSLIRQSVVDAWIRLNSPMEGIVYSLYVDVNGARVPPVPCVTVAMGCLVDPVSSALACRDWKVAGARPDDYDNVVATQWRKVKADAVRLSKLHWKYAADMTTIRLDDAGVKAMVTKRLTDTATYLARVFKGWPEFPADAQAALLSLGWACGAGWPGEFKNCAASVVRGDWLSCAIEGHMNESGNPGLVPRNKQNALMFHNAAAVKNLGLDPEVLYWPGSAPAVDPAVHQDAVEAFAAAPYPAWEQRLDALTLSLYDEQNTGHSDKDVDAFDDEDTQPTGPKH